ncbi:tRNA-guanine(15) transglycosylase-like protein [Mucidula mucida]|nr:tRNA-guanine(15) transglycosylase-like protein [Mucidula mucida]
MSASIPPASRSFSFNLSSAYSRFSPRVGEVTLSRSEDSQIAIPTPGLLVSTSRGVVPHLSRDHNRKTQPIRWVHVPFETFLEHKPPVPTLQGGEHPLHRFLGYSPDKHLISSSLRDPYDGREVPPNGNNFLSANCVRGVRKVTPDEWRSYTLLCKPDIVMAMTDIPFTPPPYSQKRITKSIERSCAWLVNLLRPIDGRHPLNVFVHMAGGTVIPARKAFADTLMEPLYAKDAEMVKPLSRLDEAIAGYSFDMVPLRLSLPVPSPQELTALFQTSLSPLSVDKPRLINSVSSPHEILALIRDVGIDLFDAHWVQRAADIGVALDFTFPAFRKDDTRSEKLHLGHNLYDHVYAHDFSLLDNSSIDGERVCPCMSCSPSSPDTLILHSSLDEPLQADQTSSSLPGFTKAYLHHLLHTHEMSAHTLLVMHNLAVLDMFFDGVRKTIASDELDFNTEVDRFLEMYDGTLRVLDDARIMWTEVEMARGKGRLAREKVKQSETSSLEITVAA